MSLFLFKSWLGLSYFFGWTDSMWMERPLENTRIVNQWEFHIPRTNQWGYTQVFGMQMIGLQEEDLSRLIGAKHPLVRLIETSMPMLVFPTLHHHHHLPAILILLLQPAVHGWMKSWITQAKRGSNGCRRITWFIITALILSDFHKDFQQIVLRIAEHLQWKILYSFIYDL